MERKTKIENIKKKEGLLLLLGRGDKLENFDQIFSPHF